MPIPIRRLLFLLLWTALPLGSRAQRVSWEYSLTPCGTNTYQLRLEATIPAGYHLYDTSPYGEGGPTPTSLRMRTPQTIEAAGPLVPATVPSYHETDNGRVGFFEEQAAFVQKIRLLAVSGEMEAVLEWMICNETSCLLPEELGLRIELPQGRISEFEPDESWDEEPVRELIEETRSEKDKGHAADISSEPRTGTTGVLLVTVAVLALIPSVMRLWSPCRKQSNPALPTGKRCRTFRVCSGFAACVLGLGLIAPFERQCGHELLGREAVIALGVVLLTCWGLWFLGTIRLRDDDTTTRLTALPLMAAILILACALYLLTGLWGASLPAIKEWLPIR